MRRRRIAVPENEPLAAPVERRRALPRAKDALARCETLGAAHAPRRQQWIGDVSRARAGDEAHTQRGIVFGERRAIWPAAAEPQRRGGNGDAYGVGGERERAV